MEERRGGLLALNISLVLGVFALLVVVLNLLGWWQRRIADAQHGQTMADLDAARAHGTDKAPAQFPMIDVQACIGCGSCVQACPENGVLGLIDGVARVIHGSRCIGHALCEEACPIGAIHVGLDAAESRPDIPLLNNRYQTSVPGISIAGELSGMALIRIATRQAVEAVDAIATELRQEPEPAAESELVDLLIVGAGPAGIAASLRATELGLISMTIDQEDIGGTVRKYPRRKLTLVGALELPLHGEVRQKEFLKEELIEFWEGIIESHGLPMQMGVKLESVEGKAGEFVAWTSRGPLYARRILLALGRRGSPRKLGVPGEEAEKVLYQLIDAATYRDQHLLVVGGGDSAVEAAMALADQPGNTVTLSYRRAEFFRLKQRNRDRVQKYGDRIRLAFQSEVRSISAESVTLTWKEGDRSGEVEIKNDYVFVCAGGEPPYRLLKEIGVEFGAEEGSVMISEPTETEFAVS